jgi:prepilin-type N-terminal cleavage/methylation domain-containing protein
MGISLHSKGGELMRNLINRKNRGFTLIELLVVIAIIGILAAVVLVSLNSARSKSRDARRLADARQIMTALELFYNDNGGYPAATSGTVAPGAAATSGGTAFSTYFAGTWPVAPTPPDNPAGVTTCNAGNNGYTYAATGSVSNGVYPGYTLSLCLGGTAGGFSAGLHTGSPSGLQ